MKAQPHAQLHAALRCEVTNQGVVMSAMQMTVTSLALTVQIWDLAEASVHSCLDSSRAQLRDLDPLNEALVRLCCSRGSSSWCPSYSIFISPALPGSGSWGLAGCAAAAEVSGVGSARSFSATCGEQGTGGLPIEGLGHGYF